MIINFINEFSLAHFRIDTPHIQWVGRCTYIFYAFREYTITFEYKINFKIFKLKKGKGDAIVFFIILLLSFFYER